MGVGSATLSVRRRRVPIPSGRLSPGFEEIVDRPRLLRDRDNEGGVIEVSAYLDHPQRFLAGDQDV
jgi:hypothetical protein